MNVHTIVGLKLDCFDNCSDSNEQAVDSGQTITVCSSDNCSYEQVSLYQLDGNISLDSSEFDEQVFSETQNQIEVIIGNRPKPKNGGHNGRPPCRRTIRRDNRGELSLYLPNIADYDLFGKRLRNKADKFEMMCVTEGH